MDTACILSPEFGQLLAEHIGTITPDTLREFCGDENFEWLKSWNRNVLPLNADMCANVGKSAESDRRQAKKNLDAITRGIEALRNGAVCVVDVRVAPGYDGNPSGVASSHER